MGCLPSRHGGGTGHENISRCRARKRYVKQLVSARRDLAAAHALYLRSLRATGAALLLFSSSSSSPPSSSASSSLTTSSSAYSRRPPHPAPPPPPPPLSPISATCTSSSAAASPVRPPPPPPLPTWDFWDPFGPSSSRPRPDAGEWDRDDEVVTTVTSSSSAAAAAPPPRSLAVVAVARGPKDLDGIVKELDEYFLKAAGAGARVSALLEAPNCDGKVVNPGRSLGSWNWSWGSSGSGGGGRFLKQGGEGMRAENGGSHVSTVEKLCAWEKKLFLEVKGYEKLKEEHERRVEVQRKLELKGAADQYIKVEKNRMEIESLESKMLVGSQAMETTTAEIIRLRECELFPQLLELLSALVDMWRGMYESHQVQTHIAQQLEYLNATPAANPTSDGHRQAALQLEAEIEHWYSSFCSLVKYQREYIYALCGWLRLSLLQCHLDPISKPAQSDIYPLCEQWQLAVDRIPDKVASEGIKTLLTAIHAITVQQSEEQKQRKRSDAAFKELEKRADDLRSLEAKYGPYSCDGNNGTALQSKVADKKVKVDALRGRADEEKSKYEKSVAVTRAVTVNNLQTGFPNVFQAMTGFASVSMQAFEAACNFRRSSVSETMMDTKRLLA